MFYDLETDTNSSSNDLKSHMDEFILIIIMLQQATRVLDQAKNMCWIFVQNPIQMDLVQYKVLHITF